MRGLSSPALCRMMLARFRSRPAATGTPPLAIRCTSSRNYVFNSVLACSAPLGLGRACPSTGQFSTKPKHIHQ
eukprot:8080201-Pyramimonas_sp.AAC.1